MDKTAQKVIDFWFTQLSPEMWWRKDAELDGFIKQEFLDVHQAASKLELSAWRQTAEGALAEIIVLDQFSRNIYRLEPRAFAYDEIALALAQFAVAQGLDKQLPLERAAFIYMPYMHSESLVIHEQALTLFSQQGLENQLHFELEHKAIIEQFGRYPHRNSILKRQSTPEELEFLQSHSGF